MKPGRKGVGPLTPTAFAEITGVSRETLARLETYAALLVKWQGRINLVASETLPDLWRRHMLDSAQLAPLIPAGEGPVVDLGSGAGFPGLVLAILGVGPVHMFESDSRKCAFLREAARVTGAVATVHNRRIEAAAAFPARAVTARALAPLDTLLGLAAPFLGADGVAVFPKGARAEEELTEARKRWKMCVERFPSLSDAKGVILRIRGVQRGAETR